MATMSTAVDPELFREVFGRFATGVGVITSTGPSGGGGMTANAICSLSLHPLLALVCFDNSARTLPIVRETRRFAINLLNDTQRDIAALFASKVPEHEKLARVPHELRGEMPVLTESLAWTVCDLRELHAGGDHTIAIGAVTELGLGSGDPLLWFEGRYHTINE